MTETTKQPTSQNAAERRPYSVVIVDDHAMFRTGVKAEIGRSVAVVGEAADADRAIAVILQTHPDVVLLDVHLPGGGGVEVIRKVHEKNPEQKFLALSVSDAAEDVIGVIRAGARGYVTKSISGSELIDAILSGRRGRRGLFPPLGRVRPGRILRIHRSGDHRRGPGPPVSTRAGSAPADRARLRVQGGGQRAVHLDQDRRDPCEQRAGSCSSPTAIN